MNEDLITNNFVENVDKVIIGRVIYAIKILLILCIVYTFLDLLQWYSYIIKSLPANNKFIDFYNYRITPSVTFIIFIARIVGWLFYLKGNKLVYASFENNEVEIFNEGYKILYKSVLISVITFAIAVVNWAVRIVLKN